MTYSEQLEHEAERDRADIEETIEELRVRLRPGHLVDQFVDQVRDGAGAQFYENLKKQIVDNPLPVTVIGAGLAWLAISNALPRRHDGYAGNGWRSSPSDRLPDGESMMPRVGERMAESARDAAEAFGEGYRSASDTAAAGYERARSGVASTGTSIREGASDLADRTSDVSRRATTRAGELYGSATERAGELYGSPRSAASRASDRMGESASRARRGISDTTQALVDFSREQPLVVAALGVAIGAALGAALPSTEAESRVMGDAAENARAKARDMVDEQADRLKSAAHDVVDRAAEGTREMAEEGESSLDRMDHGSEPDDEERQSRAEDTGSDPSDPERRFTSGDRPSNG
ncbi:MAG TPA: DUF3618 domain-containing protein [Alphaproteobacteria bacterium]|jgi:ElaB/YqjD/DUF883 family membrane-anchored ribosome-binding protein|nr:DUF3618 domain-containing protein [Alphaproteobacteria bacterium]